MRNSIASLQRLGKSLAGDNVLDLLAAGVLASLLGGRQ